MAEEDYKVSVALYLRGSELDPSAVSNALGRMPDRSQYKGERQSGAAGQEYLRNIGLWALEAQLETDSGKLADYIDALLSKIDFDNRAISKLRGLEEAFIAVFMAKNPDEEGGGTYEFEISPSQMAELSRLGVPVRFTITVVSMT